MSESIGQRLKKEREARYLTLEKASDVTRIRIIFLQALESDDYSVMPSAAQGRGFLRNYAEYLELNIDEMIAEIQRNAPPAEVSGPLPQVNLVEMEIPPLIKEDENLAPPFWKRWLGRSPKAESKPETDSSDIVAPVVETEEQSLPVETDQLTVQGEAKPGLLSKFESLFRSRIEKIDSKPETAPVVEPVIQQFVPTQPADIIFAEIGAQLRTRREMLSLTLDEVERHTKLRAVFLKALEDGTYDKLPSPVQTRGMVANYATFLDLEVDSILLRFADGLQARRYEKYSETPHEKIQTEVKTSMPFLRSFIAGDLVFGVVMIVILAALAIWGVGRVVSSQDQKTQVTVAPLLNVFGNTPLPTASLQSTLLPIQGNPVVAASTPTLDPLVTPPTPGPVANVAVSVFAVERVFARISVDGKVVFEGRFSPRETKLFEAQDQVVILTGNAAALRITYNNTDLGLMGNTGEVITRVYLISGIVTPTATIPPTPTNTPPVTNTPTPSSTPVITPTRTPPSGG
jgi:cytoskeletal protein RodZ